MSAAKVQRKATEAYQRRLDEVLAALNTDPRLGLSQAGDDGIRFLLVSGEPLIEICRVRARG